ncbi:DUF5683 domain-containing protein [Dyadobacter luticola]|uniref:DUF5683 domain-containing protein n=1 Tax=Dyadobacter luticola TaxID=1979387 RepID=A0A5R9L238_9BACT|nr:DUF5683 domain-containing protein [Dyadobacter luticola]TLV02626.1 hypothetical protein FEN17_03110 [Dyadobacter luticola]
MKNWFLLGIILLISHKISAQKTTQKDSVILKNLPVVVADSAVLLGTDTLKIVKVDSTKFYPIPKKATKMALIPGMGQIYNRDYWKAPIVYLAVGGGLYVYFLNSLKYHDYLNAYKEFFDLDKSSSTYGQPKKSLIDSTVQVRVRNLLNTSSELLPATKDQAARGKNYWRRNRGFALIVTGLLYSLSIVEANVAAHLKTFDLSEDLTLRIEPKLQQPAMKTPTPGVRLVFNIK